MPQQPETIIDKTKSPAGKIVKLLIKILITIVCFWYISGKVDFKDVLQTFKKANGFYLFAGLVLYFISKIVACIRLNIYFKQINVFLPQTANFKLYLLGLFYNLFLPGSIGGDAYKVVLLKKSLGAPYRKTTFAVLTDRFTGLLGLGLVLCLYSLVVPISKVYVVAFFIGLCAVMLISWLVLKKWMPEFLAGYWPTFFWGLLVQFFANASALLVILSLGIHSHLNEYMFIFLVASIAAVLPLTLGGLGAREVVFYHLSTYFGLDVHSSVAIGLLFYLMTVITSLMGLTYIFHNPLKDLKKSHEP